MQRLTLGRIKPRPTSTGRLLLPSKPPDVVARPPARRRPDVCLRTEFQSVPLTDTAHPYECAGSLALVIRELNSLADLKRNDIGRGHIRQYLSQNPTGLSKGGIYF